uniref:Uncharacterized protein n=1 Tax=Arundo donax TaxID=35708 RepID=A0A0A8Y4C7_ARUDO
MITSIGRCPPDAIMRFCSNAQSFRVSCFMLATFILGIVCSMLSFMLSMPI